jgi:predicted nucleic acid-binding protein
LTNSGVCVDSNLVIKLAIDEESSDDARERWSEWRRNDTEVVAPSLLYYEVTSALRNKVHRGLVLLDEALDALTELLNLPISVIYTPDIHERAWRLSTTFGRPNAYDAYYLAVAEIVDCPLWTADRRLANAVSGFDPGIHLVGQP